jgi:hypothetical protein
MSNEIESRIRISKMTRIVKIAVVLMIVGGYADTKAEQCHPGRIIG